MTRLLQTSTTVSSTRALTLPSAVSVPQGIETVGDMYPRSASAGHRAPPPWLAAWRRVLLTVQTLPLRLIALSLQAVRLQVTDIRHVFLTFKKMAAAYEGTSEHTELMEALPAATRCNHLNLKRYGNRHGRYAKCENPKCGEKWKWNDALQGWEGQSAAPSRSSAPLPPPSAATLVRQPAAKAVTRRPASASTPLQWSEPPTATSPAPKSQISASSSRTRRPREPMTQRQAAEFEMFDEEDRFETVNDQLEHATNQAVPAEMEEDQASEEELIEEYAWEDGSA